MWCGRRELRGEAWGTRERAVGASEKRSAARARAAAQVFNVSGNRLAGTLPVWMFGDNMPPWAEAGIDVSVGSPTGPAWQCRQGLEVPVGGDE